MSAKDGLVILGGLALKISRQTREATSSGQETANQLPNAIKGITGGKDIYLNSLLIQTKVSYCGKKEKKRKKRKKEIPQMTFIGKEEK